MNMISEYFERVSNAQKESEVKKVANEFSDDILEYESFPEDYSELLIQILSSNECISKKGAFHFLVLIGADTDIMTPKQLDSIATTIVSNYINYEDDMLCLTSCDFIARYYPYSSAKSYLSKLKEIESSKSQKGFADDGIRILENEIKRSES